MPCKNDGKQVSKEGGKRPRTCCVCVRRRNDSRSTCACSALRSLSIDDSSFSLERVSSLSALRVDVSLASRNANLYFCIERSQRTRARPCHHQYTGSEGVMTSERKMA